MSILQFPTQSKPPFCDTEVITAVIEVLYRFLAEGGDEDGNNDLEAFVKALREEMNRERFQFRFDFDPDHAS
jgi:hypothetical protein